MTWHRWTIATACVFVLAACGEDETPFFPTDTSSGDAAGGDASSDTGGSDAGMDDTGMGTDTGMGDAGMDDTGMGTDTGMDDAGMDDTGTGPDCVPFSDIMLILDEAGCTNGYCHGGGAGGLDLTMAYDSLVEVPSVGAAGETRVVPGDPDASYLIHKLEGTQSAGNQMPPIGPLDEQTIDTIRAWIASGAAETCE